jgi:hypothetical protein
MTKNILIICGFARSGKQQPNSEPVLTPSGWTPIGSLKVGDFVVGSNGTLTKIKGVYPQTDRRVFAVTFQDGSVVRAGADHLWKVYTHKLRAKNRTDSGDRHQVLTTQQLLDKGLQFPTGAFRYSVPAYNPGLGGYKEEHAYVIGYALGNGSVNGDVLTISCHQKLQFQVVDALNKSLGLPLGIRHTSTYDVQINYSWSSCPDSVKALRDGGLSHEKRMPENFEFWNLESREALLAGLLDADGHFIPNSSSVNFTSTNLDLLNGVRTLARANGHLAMERVCTDSRTHYKSGFCAGLHIRLRKDISRLGNLISFRGFGFEPIIRAISLLPYEEDSTCIEVEADDCMYTTANYKMTHNTSLVNELKEECWSVASTSNVLDVICYNLLDIMDVQDIDFEKKLGTIFSGRYEYTPREFKIKVAEEVIVPMFGREAIVEASFKNCDEYNIVCESIGGAELDILLAYIRKNFPDSPVLVLNMRSALELKGVDIRKLATKEQCYPHVLKEYQNLFIPFRGLKDYIHEFFGITRRDNT